MWKIVGSRRGKPLLPLAVQWPAFIVSAIVTCVLASSWLRGRTDSYPHEHARLALLSSAVTLMAASGVVRHNRKLHVVLFLSGGVLLLATAFLR